MANIHADNHLPKKQKIASSARGVEKRKALGTSPFKTKRKRLTRRISSARSRSDSQENILSKTPVFRQPQQGLHPSSHSSHSGSGLTRNHVPPAVGTQPSQARITREPAINDDDDEGEEEDEEEVIGRSSKEGLTKYMRNLTTTNRYTAFGKAFALKYWPWPSYNWWADRGDSGGLGNETNECELAVEREFLLYMGAVSIKETEWMTSSFRTPVIALVHILESSLTTSY